MKELITNTWKITLKKQSSYIQYLEVNNSYGWTMSQKLPVKNFEKIKDTTKFNKDFIKIYNEESDKRHFSKLRFNIMKN